MRRDTRNEVLTFLYNNGRSKSRVVANGTGLTPLQCRNAIAKAKAAGLVERHEPSGYWQLTSDDKGATIYKPTKKKKKVSDPKPSTDLVDGIASMLADNERYKSTLLEIQRLINEVIK